MEDCLICLNEEKSEKIAETELIVSTPECQNKPGILRIS